MKVYGEILKPSQLRFNYTSTYALASSPRQGLRQFGPYDSHLFQMQNIRCGIIYPTTLHGIKDALLEGLAKGEGNFAGFKNLFRVPLSFEEEQSVTQETALSIRKASNSLASRNLDLIYILCSRQNGPLYQACKAELLGNGIPSQVIIGERLANPTQRQWILENIALASYAKVGGTPWVVASPKKERQLILGVSRVQDYNKTFLVGFVTLFTQDGDFLLMHSKAPFFNWDKYVEGLSTLIAEAVNEYQSISGLPDSIILHLHKRPGYKELESIRAALDGLGTQVPYALLHLNEYSNFRLFDTNHWSYIPNSNLKVDLSYHEALLLLDGRVGDQRRRVGVPRVLDVVMDRRSTIPVEAFSELVQQISDFSRVNWRGFNAAAIPVTINYARLIARLVLEVGISNWNQVICAGKLKDKAWFL